MKRLIIPVAFLGVIIVIALIAIVMFNQNDGGTSSSKAEVISEYATSEDLGDLAVTDASNAVFYLKDLNKTTLLTFWSVGCTECKQALTDLRDYKTAHPEVDVTLVNFRNTPDEATAKLKEYGIEFSTYYDRDADLFNSLSASIPSSYMLKNDKIIYFFPGRIGSDFLDQLLTEFQK